MAAVLFLQYLLHYSHKKKDCFHYLLYPLFFVGKEYFATCILFATDNWDLWECHLNCCFLFLVTDLKMVTINFFSAAMPSSWTSFPYFVLGKTSVIWTQTCSKCSWAAFLGQSLLRQNNFHQSRDTEWTKVQWSDHFSYNS